MENKQISKQTIDEKVKYCQDILDATEELKAAILDEFQGMPDRIERARLYIEVLELENVITSRKQVLHVWKEHLKRWQQNFEIESKEANDSWDVLISDAYMAITKQNPRTSDLPIQKRIVEVIEKTKTADLTDQQTKTDLYLRLKMEVINFRRGGK